MHAVCLHLSRPPHTLFARLQAAMKCTLVCLVAILAAASLVDARRLPTSGRRGGRRHLQQVVGGAVSTVTWNVEWDLAYGGCCLLWLALTSKP